MPGTPWVICRLDSDLFFVVQRAPDGTYRCARAGRPGAADIVSPAGLPAALLHAGVPGYRFRYSTLAGKLCDRLNAGGAVVQEALQAGLGL